MSDEAVLLEQPLIEPLTWRERDILRLQAEGHTAPEIAQQLNLALNSVKWYIQRLYGKLGVNSKQSAVLRARQLDLLGSPAPASVPGLSPPHNLPLQLTRFFGREVETAQLKERLAEHRLVTLTGPGGVGKTRLSLRVVDELLSYFPDGVWLVELAHLTNP
ncbi:MAG: LuxR C-terminal-related transcriptional regulator, partial [Anaerolineales bacterium]